MLRGFRTYLVAVYWRWWIRSYWWPGGTTHCEGWGATPPRGSSNGPRLSVGRHEWSGCIGRTSPSQTASGNSARCPPGGCSFRFQRWHRVRWKTHTPVRRLLPRLAGSRCSPPRSAPRTRIRRTASPGTTARECCSLVVLNQIPLRSHSSRILPHAVEPLQSPNKRKIMTKKMMSSYLK